MMPDEILAFLPDARALKLYAQLSRVARVCALDELASGFAHELNQPLGAIATFAQAGRRMLLREQRPNDSVVDVLQQVSTQALVAGESIHRIRALFAIPVGNRVHCQPRDVLGDVRPILDAIASRGGAKAEVNLGSELPSVQIDPLQIQYVVLVLTQNAVEAARLTDTSLVRIDVTGDAYAIRLTVSDSGPGVPHAARNKLFRPFFTTKRTGVGLGLASSRSVVESHGGRIGYEEAAGGGSQFWFSLPAATR